MPWVEFKWHVWEIGHLSKAPFHSRYAGESKTRQGASRIFVIDGSRPPCTAPPGATIGKAGPALPGKCATIVAYMPPHHGLGGLFQNLNADLVPHAACVTTGHRSELFQLSSS